MLHYIIIIEFAHFTEIFPHIDATICTNLSNLKIAKGTLVTNCYFEYSHNKEVIFTNPQTDSQAALCHKLHISPETSIKVLCLFIADLSNPKMEIDK